MRKRRSADAVRASGSDLRLGSRRIAASACTIEAQVAAARAYYTTGLPYRMSSIGSANQDKGRPEIWLTAPADKLQLRLAQRLRFAHPLSVAPAALL